MSAKSSPAPVSALDGRTVAVTGAAGFIGAFTTAELAARGATVLAVDRHPGPRPQLAALVAEGRVAFLPTGTRWPYRRAWWDEAERKGLLSGIDTVVHLGYAEPAATDPLTSYRQEVEANVMASIEMLGRLGPQVTTLCAASSALLYGRRHREPVTERHTVDPDSPYGQAKHDLEQALSWWADGERCVVAARIATVYGATETVPRAVPNFIRRALAGHQPDVEVAADERDYVHVTDVARGLATVVEAASPTVGRFPRGLTAVNLGTGTATTTEELARTILALIDPDLQPSVSPPGREPVSVVVDPGRLRALTGFTPRVDLATGLADEVAWIRHHPELWRERVGVARTRPTPP
ncbi:MAG: NAD-dependent epimerase/dehydratase family protein [Acidimicrobiales bacterium]